MTMDANELRALADAIVYRDSLSIARAADYLRACADEKPVGYVTANGLRSLRQDDATVLLYAHDYLIRPDHVALYTRPAPAAPQAEPIDPHMIAAEDRFPDAPQAEPKREALHGLAPTHRCPACGAFWRQCDDASWNLRSASCCGLCDAGRVELVCWLDEPKREPLTMEQINALPEAQGWWPHAANDRIVRLLRAVERAHGIGGSDE